MHLTTAGVGRRGKRATARTGECFSSIGVVRWSEESRRRRRESRRALQHSRADERALETDDREHARKELAQRGNLGHSSSKGGVSHAPGRPGLVGRHDPLYALGRSPSTISRELRRNACHPWWLSRVSGEYRAVLVTLSERRAFLLSGCSPRAIAVMLACWPWPEAILARSRGSTTATSGRLWAISCAGLRMRSLLRT